MNIIYSNMNVKKMLALEIADNPKEAKDFTLDIWGFEGVGNVTIEAETLEDLRQQYYDLIENIGAYRLEYLSLEYKDDYITFDDYERDLIDFILND